MARGLAKMSVGEIHAELRRRERSIRKLERRRTSLLTKLGHVDDEIRAMGGSANGRARAGGGRRPRNEMTLVESLTKVLSGKTMSVTDAAEAVQRAGYRTNSNNFRTQVNIALIKGGKFKRVGRGQYTAK
jgi:hypothetical protein